MLAQLTISNFAIVRELEIDFHSGMTAITGETGAGKSIAIDALGLCLGGRAKPTWCAEAPAVPTCAPASP
jgi:DNA repair protein RecN (Recombination protein N)